MVYPHANTLLSVPTNTTANQTGTTFIVVARDEVDPIQAAVAITASQSDGASSPTVSVICETSADGVNWVEAHKVDLSSTTTATELEVVTILGPYVRARSVLGGGTRPNHNCKVSLLTTEPIQLLVKA